MLPYSKLVGTIGRYRALLAQYSEKRGGKNDCVVYLVVDFESYDEGTRYDLP